MSICRYTSSDDIPHCAIVLSSGCTLPVLDTIPNPLQQPYPGPNINTYSNSILIVIPTRTIPPTLPKPSEQDLVSKSAILLAFLGFRNALTERHMDALWSATRGAHEAVVRVLHQLILFIVPVLEPALRMYLFMLISKVNPLT